MSYFHHLSLILLYNIFSENTNIFTEKEVATIPPLPKRRFVLRKEYPCCKSDEKLFSHDFTTFIKMRKQATLEENHYIFSKLACSSLITYPLLRLEQASSDFWWWDLPYYIRVFEFRTTCQFVWKPYHPWDFLLPF